MFRIFIFLISLAASEATYCSSPEVDTLYIYPNEKNCSVFLACVAGEQYEFDCIEASMFLPWANDPLCIPDCDTESTTRKTVVKTVTELPPDPALYPDSSSRTIICPPTGDTKAIVAQSCTEYISCSGGIGTKETCPEGQEFSPSRYSCIARKNSDCSRQKLKGSHHLKCRYDKGTDPIYFSSEYCPVFKKCANQLAWDVKCAQYCHWNNEQKTCDWADSFDCNLTNQ